MFRNVLECNGPKKAEVAEFVEFAGISGFREEPEKVEIIGQLNKGV